ncbi:MAG: hypothetical protein U5S82_16040 [Gammaproteobacteria bacterium]|nr:hypothetical protein [Gammaproteobacteria bacterium]
MPLSGGVCLKKRSKFSKPPAEAPRPTTQEGSSVDGTGASPDSVAVAGGAPPAADSGDSGGIINNLGKD